jgi:hypothetical protein
MDDLKKQAEELGIKVDGRWSEDRLREEIDKATTLGAPMPNMTDRLIAVRVLRDFWNDDGDRIRKGTIAEVTVDAALDGVENGILSRVK